MVLISSKKYACETCIKGHRSSGCKHTDRPLFEIKKKGRPVTQCDHCRELRKTKQVHVKCMCEAREVRDESLVKKKGISKTLEYATFPSGLPSAAMESSADGAETSSSGSDTPGCRCHVGETCDCCNPRTKTIKPRKKASNASSCDSDSSRSHPGILARIAELRPVLPKPPQEDNYLDGPVHNPSAHIPHTSAHRHSDAIFFSPYSKAYDNVHISEIGQPLVHHPIPQEVVEPESVGFTANYLEPTMDTRCGNPPLSYYAYEEDQYNDLADSTPTIRTSCLPSGTQTSESTLSMNSHSAVVASSSTSNAMPTPNAFDLPNYNDWYYTFNSQQNYLPDQETFDMNAFSAVSYGTSMDPDHGLSDRGEDIIYDQTNRIQPVTATFGTNLLSIPELYHSRSSSTSSLSSDSSSGNDYPFLPMGEHAAQHFPSD